MGSRYDGPRYSSGDLGYGRGEPSPRWDADRFTREREVRYNDPPAAERPYDGYGRRMEDRYARREEPRFEEKYFAEERYGPPARRVDKKYYEEDEVYDSRGPPAGALVPYRSRREEPPPPRPELLRRQSSLDTFDRKQPRRYEEYDREEIRGPPPMPVPPRAPRYAEPAYDREYDERDYRYKEREWISQRHRDERDEREERESIREEEVIEDFGEREKPFPRRGKTRMPRRLVVEDVLYDLRYPFHYEGESIIIEVALSKEQIDEVVALSRRYPREETTTVHLIEAPHADIREEKIIEKVETLSLADAPRSVREWDHMSSHNLSVRSPSPSHKSHRSRSRVSRVSRSRRSSSSSDKPEKIIDVHRDSITVREVSPARTERTSRTHKSHRSRKSSHAHESRHSSPDSSHHSGTEIIERREIIERDEDESNSVHVGPLALVVDRERRKSRSERDIKAEIRALEEERRALEREREDRNVVKVRRGEIERDVEEDSIRVKKDKKAPSAAMMRAMLATLT